MDEQQSSVSQIIVPLNVLGGKITFRSDLTEAISALDLTRAVSGIAPVRYMKGLNAVFVKSIVDAELYPCDYFTAEYNWEDRSITLYIPLWHQKEKVYRAWFGEAWTPELMRDKLLGSALRHELSHHISLHIMGNKELCPTKGLTVWDTDISEEQRIFDKEEEERADAIHEYILAQEWKALDQYVWENTRFKQNPLD
jgi:hypothetical protein